MPQGMRIHRVSCRRQIPMAVGTGARWMFALVVVGTCLHGHLPSVEGTPLASRFQQKPWGRKRNGVQVSGLWKNRLLSMDRLEACRWLGETTFRGGSQETAQKVDKKKSNKSDKNKKEDTKEKEEEALQVQDESEGDEIEGDQEEDDDEQEEETVASSVELEESREYDEPLAASQMLSFYITIGIMVLSQKIDLFNPLVVRAVRFAFIGYIIILQAFLLYVRIRAKAENNRAPVKLSNPVTNLLQQQFQGTENTNAMVKNLASSFLSSESTVLEYDLKQAKGMQGGLMVTMGFMWLLHFKFQQIQPVLVQTVTGLMNLFYSPLFQVYVMGRNLERPFKNPAMDRNREVVAQQADVSTNASEATETTIDDDESESMTADEDAEDNDNTEDEEDVDEVEGEED